METSNPFSYSGYVSGQSFCNRQEEKKALHTAIRNSQNLLLYSHRRTGKTSLIHELIKELGKKKPRVDSIYIDLYGTLDEGDFIRSLFEGVGKLESRLDRILKLASGLKLVVGVDDMSGMPTFTPSFEARESPLYLEKTMKLLQTFSGKKKLLVVFDEFQEVAEYKEEGFEKRLRKEIQKHSNICYIFSGSQSHILNMMFSSKRRAFYKLARSFPLAPIRLAHYKTWAKKLFRLKKTTLPNDVITEIVARCKHQPLYIQQFLYDLWNGEKMSVDEIDRIERAILIEHDKEFIERWDSLTLNQKKTLKLIIKTGGKGLFIADALSSVGFRSTSVINRAISSLKKREIIYKNSRWRIQDAMFEKWIESLVGA